MVIALPSAQAALRPDSSSTQEASARARSSRHRTRAVRGLLLGTRTPPPAPASRNARQPALIPNRPEDAQRSLVQRLAVSLMAFPMSEAPQGEQGKPSRALIRQLFLDLELFLQKCARRRVVGLLAGELSENVECHGPGR